METYESVKSNPVQPEQKEKKKRRCMERGCSGDSCGRRCGKYHDFCV